MEGAFLFCMSSITESRLGDQKGEWFANSRKLVHGHLTTEVDMEKTMYQLLVFAFISAGIIFDQYQGPHSRYRGARTVKVPTWSRHRCAKIGSRR